MCLKIKDDMSITWSTSRIRSQRADHLLGGLLLLLLLLLGIITTLIISRGFSGSFFLLLLFLNSNKESNNLLGLDHVVLINLELIEDVVNLSLVHLVSPGHEGVLEHLDINLAALIVGHESLEDQLIGIVAVSGHFLLEHVDHAVDVAGSTDLAHQLVQLTLRHEDTNVVEGSTQVVLVQGAILVDIHQLEAVLVHLDLLPH